MRTLSTATLAAAALILSACGGAAGSGDAPPATVEVAAPTDCAATFEPAKGYGSFQYYRLVFQFRSCMAQDMPFSVDLGSVREAGKPLKGARAYKDGATGEEVSGPAVLWTQKNTCAFTPCPLPTTTPATKPVANPAQTVIQKGNGATGAGVETTEFSTLPYWNGFMPSQNGPCATSTRWKEGSGELGYPDFYCTSDPYNKQKTEYHETTGSDNFMGAWAIYLPTVTLKAELVNQVPFPYISYYSQTTDTQRAPGAVATGILVTRSQPGRGSLPFFSEDSVGRNAPSAKTFIPNGCVDNLTILNGSNEDNRVSTDWSTKLKEGSGTPWDMVVQSKNINGTPSLFLINGWMNTNGGKYFDIQLQDPINKSISTRPHLIRGYLQDLNDKSCGTGVVPVSMIGGEATLLDLKTTRLPVPVIANSTIRGGDFTQVTNTSGDSDTGATRDTAIYGFTRFIDATDSTDTTITSKFSSVDLPGANLTGSLFPNADLSWANFKDANLSYADLSTANLDNANTNGMIRCHTLLAPEDYSAGKPVENTEDCITALPEQEKWEENVAEKTGCNPAKCAYISIYNNTTRYLSEGLVNCQYGDRTYDVYSSNVIGPLATGKIGFTQFDREKPPLVCGMTYANGPWGKLQVTAISDGKKIDGKAGPGYCAYPDSANCLPKAAPKELIPAAAANTDEKYKKSTMWPPARDDGSPVRFSIDTHRSKNEKVTLIDVVLCEPEAYNESAKSCPTKPALPTWPAGYAVPKQDE